MKTGFITALFALASSAGAVTMTANFNALTAPTVGTAYQESGILFSSPSPLIVANGYFYKEIFGGVMTGTGLTVKNNGFVSISTPGSLIDSIRFTGGFDWNFYLIEYGLMDITFDWQSWTDGNMTASGSTTWGRDNRTHVFGADINPSQDFDTLLIRSTAIGYEPIYTGGTGPGGWYYERGAPINYGDLNHIAFDNVVVETVGPQNSRVAATAYDGGNSGVLFALVIGVIAAIRRKL